MKYPVTESLSLRANGVWSFLIGFVCSATSLLAQPNFGEGFPSSLGGPYVMEKLGYGPLSWVLAPGPRQAYGGHGNDIRMSVLNQLEVGYEGANLLDTRLRIRSGGGQLLYVGTPGLGLALDGALQRVGIGPTDPILTLDMVTLRPYLTLAIPSRRDYPTFRFTIGAQWSQVQHEFSNLAAYPTAALALQHLLGEGLYNPTSPLFPQAALKGRHTYSALYTGWVVQVNRRIRMGGQVWLYGDLGTTFLPHNPQGDLGGQKVEGWLSLNRGGQSRPQCGLGVDGRAARLTRRDPNEERHFSPWAWYTRVYSTWRWARRRRVGFLSAFVGVGLDQGPATLQIRTPIEETLPAGTAPIRQSVGRGELGLEYYTRDQLVMVATFTLGRSLGPDVPVYDTLYVPRVQVHTVQQVPVRVIRALYPYYRSWGVNLRFVLR